MRTFYDGATCHYIRSSQMFHSSMVRSPALFLMSKRDPIGKPESNQRVADNWEALGIDVCVFVCFRSAFFDDVSIGAFENLGEFASRWPFQEVS
jgi:predicted alpha/beta hydrolase family esterase